MRRGAAFLVMAALFVASCSVPRKVWSVQVRDSVAVHIKDSTVFRDSVILVPVPEGTASAIRPPKDTSHLETSTAVSDAWIAEGRLHHTLRNRTGAVIPTIVTVPLRLREEARYSSTVIQEIRYREKELSRWQKFKMQAGGLFIITFFLFVGGICLYAACLLFRKFR